MRLTKLVCTIGPASRERLPDLIAAGLDVARLNLSHGDPATHRENAARVRAAAADAGRPVAALPFNVIRTTYYVTRARLRSTIRRSRQVGRRR